MDNIVNDFNDTANMCIEFILSVTNDSDLRFYKKAIDKIQIIDKNKLIEQFIIHCLPHYDHFMTNNESYFIELKYVNIGEVSLIEALKLHEYFISLKSDVKELIFQYLKLLCNFSKEYLQLRLR